MYQELEGNSIIYASSSIKLKIDGEEVGFFNPNVYLKSEINNHSKLNIKFSSQQNQEEFYLRKMDSEDVKISLEVTIDEGANKLLFVGYIKEIDFYIYDGALEVEVEADSQSILLDRENKYISYQDLMTTYSDILNQKKDIYSSNDIGIVWEKLNMAQDELIIQYNETDWEFLKRLLKKQNKAIINIGTGLRLGFGSQGRENVANMNITTVKLKKEYKNSYGLYILDGNEVFLVGEKVKVNYNGKEENLVIIGSEYKTINGVICSSYKCVKEETFELKKQSHEKIAGKGIEGTIVEVLDEEGIAKMTVEFNTNLVKRGAMVEDERGNEVEASKEEQIGSELFKFPYVTPYSQSHTGYFCTPEVGDNVMVYFPTEKEEDAFVLGAVNSIGNGRFTDRFNRNFIIPAEGSENGEGTDEPQYDMILANSIYSVTTGTSNIEVEFENLNVLEDSTKVIGNNLSIKVENDMMNQVTNNKTVQVDNNLSFKVSNDYQAQSTNHKIQASASVNAEGSSGVNIKGAQVKVEADAEATIKGGAMVKVGAPSVNVGS